MKKEKIKECIILCTLIPYIYLVLLQFINNKEKVYFVPYKIYSFFALMGNPVRFGLPQLFSENTIREILEDPNLSSLPLSYSYMILSKS